MAFFPIFFSVVLIVQNQSSDLEKLLLEATSIISPLVSDYELIVIDNASHDESITILKKLAGEQGIANLQVYALTKEVDHDMASWVGLENGLGDFVAVINPLSDDIGFLVSMLEKAVSGADVVFAENQYKVPQSFFYRSTYRIFNRLYKWFNGIDLGKEAPAYRILSKRLINFVLQHPQPAISYRHLPATAGFSRIYLTYSALPKIISTKRKKLIESIDKGMRFLVVTTRLPMRLVTSLSLFGAIANLIYSIYVVSVAILKSNVAPGWTSLSLQQSGMFFLISLVLLVLGEYILNMASLSNEGPGYHVGQEFTSMRQTYREKLNVETVASVLHTEYSNE